MKAAVLAGLVLVGVLAASARSAAPDHSPIDLAFSPDGRRLAVADQTAAEVVLFQVSTRRRVWTTRLEGHPVSIAWATKPPAIVTTEPEAGTVVLLEPATGRILRRFEAGIRPSGLAVGPGSGELLVANPPSNEVRLLNLASSRELRRVEVTRWPLYATFAPEGAAALVCNFLPAGAATDPDFASSISVVDPVRGRVESEIRLPSGSIMPRQIVMAPGGRWAFVVHALARFALPANQIDRGWLNTSALSILDLARREHFVTVLLDQFGNGAADPWGAQLSREGNTLWITLSGVHELARVDVGELLRRLTGPASPKADTNGGIWDEIRREPAQRALLANDLDALPRADLIRRFGLPGKGLRALQLSPDGGLLAVAAYFSSAVLLADATTGKLVASLDLGKNPTPSDVRRGEEIFHDATYSLQHWASCASCHPDGRTDAGNWDLMNDGIGTPKNTKSLLLAHLTPPAMARGVRTNMEQAALAGFRFTLNQEAAESDVEAVRAYIRSLTPEKSPWLAPNGELTERAARGKELFERPELRCAFCHPGPLFTDLKLHDVGTGQRLEEGERFDTPTLVELWRTAPYLHHGGAITLRDVFTRFNPRDRHGVTTQLTEEALEALVEYLLSL